MRLNKLFEGSNNVYYHGTNREFGKFEIGADKANRATNITGIYFTPHQWEAEEYGQRVIQARLHYKKLFNVQKWNDINGAMKRKALELLAKHTTYREEWLKSAIIPDLVEKGYFAGGLRDVSGDIKREILLAGGYDAIKDGDHIAMLTTDGIELIESVEEDYDWEQEEGYDFENPLAIIDDPDVWDGVDEVEGDIIEAWEEETGQSWRDTHRGPAGFKNFWESQGTVEDVPLNKIVCTEKWLKKDQLDAIMSGAARKTSGALPIIHVVNGQYIATDGNHRIVAEHLQGAKSIKCRVLKSPMDH